MAPRGRVGFLRVGFVLGMGLACSHCAEPKFREADASEMQTVLADDASSPDAGDASESLEQRMQDMVGRYFMQLSFRADDPAKPLINGLSLVEISLGADGLTMRERPCHYHGSSNINGLAALSDFDASRVPETLFRLSPVGSAFESDQPVAALGYDLQPPTDCAPGQTLATSTTQKPWLDGAPCKCPSDSTTLPESFKVDDCRINDDDHDGNPGITLVARIVGFDAVEMFMVQRSRDHYVNLHFKDGQREVLIGDFETTRVPSLLGCNPAGGLNCMLAPSASCPAEFSSAELVRVSAEEKWTCARLREAAAFEDWFREPPPASCAN